jgi:hypothetical protein
LTDYPDYTDLVHIIGCDVTFNIEITGATVMMPVDIQAQYITLSIDIVAQTVGNIAIDIAAQTIGDINVNLAASDITLNINIESSSITLNVDITAQTIGNLTIDISAQTVGVYLQPDWNVLQGTDMNQCGSASCPNGTSSKVLEYSVTGGKTLYICQWGFMATGNTGLFAGLYKVHNSTETLLILNGGLTGGGQSLTKPVAIIGGDKVRIYVTQWSGGTLNGGGAFGGYEI